MAEIDYNKPLDPESKPSGTTWWHFLCLWLLNVQANYLFMHHSLECFHVVAFLEMPTHVTDHIRLQLKRVIVQSEKSLTFEKEKGQRFCCQGLETTPARMFLAEQLKLPKLTNNIVNWATYHSLVDKSVFLDFFIKNAQIDWIVWYRKHIYTTSTW